MKFALPHIPLWVVVVVAGAVGAGSIGVEFVEPRASFGPPLENEAGFYAAAGFLAALVALAGGRLARLLRVKAPDA
ncbi:MAG: hypothetical protein IV086_07095 [Hyphomonadaceae bacterium]|nr:MAG: hypothetical protein FD160_3862 [Caulobacteraceae bacterium]MBT9445446.1 hypothetical protein [Hyphomonadaceae bacterium]TPW02065.1 MAG: hypothetical protein FD124_3525 [Alphaproteobacteria bacterium]